MGGSSKVGGGGCPRASRCRGPKAWSALRSARVASSGLSGAWRSREESASKSALARSWGVVACVEGVWSARVSIRDLLRSVVLCCGRAGPQTRRSRSSRVSWRARSSPWPRRARTTDEPGRPGRSRAQSSGLRRTVAERWLYSTVTESRLSPSRGARTRGAVARRSGHTRRRNRKLILFACAYLYAAVSCDAASPVEDFLNIRGTGGASMHNGFHEAPAFRCVLDQELQVRGMTQAKLSRFSGVC